MRAEPALQQRETKRRVRGTEKTNKTRATPEEWAHLCEAPREKINKYIYKYILLELLYTISENKKKCLIYAEIQH